MPSTRSRDRDLIATTSNLVEFLRDVAMARRRRIVDVSEYETVLWLDDLPEGARIDSAAGPGETLLSMPRLRMGAPPEPPAALTNWIDKEAIRDSSANPVLKEKGPAWVHVTRPDGSKGMAAKIVNRAEAPDVARSFDVWFPQWQAWAERDRQDEPRRRWYSALAGAAHLVGQQDDQYELVLGIGLLGWATPSGTALRNFLFTTRLVATVDAERDEVRLVIDSEGATRAEDRELLEGEPGYDPSRVESLHEQIRTDAVSSPMVDGEPLAKVWAERALDAETEFDPQWAPLTRAEANAVVRLAPALILRRRERASLIGYYDAMLRALRGPDAQAPLGLAQLVTTMEARERLDWLEEVGSVSGEVLGSDPLFPLPANPEQMRIIERLASNNGVVVQGPPGTGKTHTIANLISALLAQGQRVLVTSQKAQALRVLREKLPTEIARLCVSITDLGSGGSAELEASVKAMSNRYAAFDAAAHADEVSRVEAKRTRLAARVRQLTDALRELREGETIVHAEVAPGYTGTLGEIARKLNTAAGACDWMPAPMPSEPAPLTAAGASELISLLRRQTPQRAARLTQRQIDISEYASEAELTRMITLELAAVDIAAAGSTEVSRRLAGCDGVTLAKLRTFVDTANRAATLLGLGPDSTAWPDYDWAVRAISDGLAGLNTSLWAQLASGRSQVDSANGAVRSLGFRSVVIGGAAVNATANLALVGALKDHLASGGKLRSAFKSGVQRSAEPILRQSRVDGVPVATVEQVDLLHVALQAQASMDNLARGWGLVGYDLGLSSGEAIHQTVARVVDTYARLDLVKMYLDAVAQARSLLHGTSAWLALGELEQWRELATAVEAAQLRVDAEGVAGKIDAVAQRLTLDSHGADTPPELAEAIAAVRARDAAGYGQALAALAAVGREQGDESECAALMARLGAVHPALAELMSATAADPAWARRLVNWDAAWAWGRANAFFADQREPGRDQELEAELADTVARLRTETAALAAARAWGACLHRMTAHQAQALQAYEQHMRSVGKGTGRYAAKYRSLAREAMREASDAVPAWIMPLDVVLDTLPPVRDSFDVVIVDEASQASLEDLFLLWLAPRVIVVGDDKQCAPSQIRLGELEPIFSKLSSYLPELPAYLRDAYTPRSSLFDLLRTRFGAVIPLREHFRCMPEIIAFSSAQFYADEPLVPLRQFGADRLPPLKAVRVAGAVTEGTSTRMRNKVEASAIVDAISACLADPVYQDKTFGVVVLQGTGQVQLLHQLLLEKIEPKEWERRRLRVGSPPDFQGDERDVIFLSMVVADKRAAVTSTEWQRRFNVAASRAKDQMWLFHSIAPQQLSVADLRTSLLSYVLSPPASFSPKLILDVTANEPHPAFQSVFEQRVFLRLRERGYHVEPQVEVGGRRIDLVVTGATGRLAIKCDASNWLGSEAQRRADIDAEQELKRSGWRFWRVRESEFNYDSEAALTSLWTTLERLGIAANEPLPAASGAAGGGSWLPAVLSDTDGLDGLEGGAPEELDDVHLPPARSR